MDIFETNKLQMMASSTPMETSEHLALFLFQYNLTPIAVRKYTARVGGLKVGALSFALVDFGAAMRLEAAAQGDYYVMMSCLRGSADLRLDGRSIRVGAGAGFFSRPSKHVSGDFSEDCVRLIVRIDPALLDKSDVRDLEQMFSLTNPSMLPWLTQVQLLLSSPPLMRALESDQQLRSQMEVLLLAMLRYGQLQQPARAPLDTESSRDVRRAEAFIRLHGDGDISLENIAVAAGVSARTLQANFLRYRNTTPTQYLRAVRLESARSRLQFGGHGIEVTDIALESGFKHLGRFAASYRERYGETPSATLRRSSSLPRQAH